MCGPSNDDDWVIPKAAWPLVPVALAVCGLIWWLIATAPDMTVGK